MHILVKKNVVQAMLERRMDQVPAVHDSSSTKGAREETFQWVRLATGAWAKQAPYSAFQDDSKSDGLDGHKVLTEHGSSPQLNRGRTLLSLSGSYRMMAHGGSGQFKLWSVLQLLHFLLQKLHLLLQWL